MTDTNCVYCDDIINVDDTIYYVWACDGYAHEECYLEMENEFYKEEAQKMSKDFYKER